MSFVHLHRHGDFSLLDGIGKDEEYVKRAAELGQSALALTDHGSLAGVLYHVEACVDAGIKPIVGMEAYFRPDIKADREAKRSNSFYHLVLLAKNQEGFKNLMRLSTQSYMEENFYMKPNVDWRMLRENSEGIIASSSCVSGYLPQLYLDGQTEEAEKVLRVFQDIFGDDFFLETQPHDFNEQRKINLDLINLANKTGIPVVATADVHYPFEDWADSQMIFKMIRTNSSIKKMKEDPDEGKDFVAQLDTLWLMSEDEIKELFYKHHTEIPHSYIDEMVSNSGVIAERIEDFTYDKSPKIPRAAANDRESESILREWCSEGLIRISRESDQQYLERVEQELSVFRKLKVLDYFVIVGDMVRWAKQQEIRVGPGRGSAAGSLVNYLIGITAVDPLGYGLLFERFMNEYRTELPDIDIDFQDDRRDEVKQYLKEKWGDEYVVDIAAFQSFGHKGVIKDVARVLDVSFIEANRVTDYIPQSTKLFGKDMSDLEDMVPEVKAFFDKYPEVRKHSHRLFGQIKGQSKHAAAVIVTDKPAIDLIPMMRSKDLGMVTQWSERANAQLISPYGFLKIDCLSTDDLTVQDMTTRLIKERHGINIDLDDVKQFPMLESPYEVEEDVVAAFADGANIGVFQFGSSGIIGLLKQIKPTNLEHLIAANALYRPGTLENNVAFDYARRKNGLMNWKLPHESVKEYIEYTFGFMVFQEQVMQIYSALAKDATSVEAAVFLKVVSKGVARDLDGKKKMQTYYDKFAAGCEEKGIPQKNYELLWNQVLQMSTYSFNKSHSTGYAIQGYQDKYLKMRYPLEHYASLLTIETDKIAQIIRESKMYGINILPPDINTSKEGFTIDGNAIRFGLLGIKDIGPATIAEIEKKRPFDSWEDLLRKVEKSKCNAKHKKALFASGALDSLGARTQWILDEDVETKIPATLDVIEMAAMEKEKMGFSVSKGDDIMKYKEIIEERITLPENYEHGEETFVAGEVINVKEINTKKGHKMAFVEIDYLNNSNSLTIFPKHYSRFSHMLVDGTPIMVIGDWDEERQTVVAEHICTAEQLYLELNSKNGNSGKR